jgi:hypothetical protein
MHSLQMVISMFQATGPVWVIAIQIAESRGHGSEILLVTNVPMASALRYATPRVAVRRGFKDRIVG